MVDIVSKFQQILIEYKSSNVFQDDKRECETGLIFNSPISSENAKEISRLLNYDLPLDFNTLYGFADGDASFLGLEWMNSKKIIYELTWNIEELSLADQVSKNYHPLYEISVKDLYLFNRWLPLFSLGNKNFIGIDLTTKFIGERHQIILYSHNDSEIIILAPSLENFFDKVLIILKNEEKSKLFSSEKPYDALAKLVKENKF